MVTREQIQSQLDNCLLEAKFPQWESRYKRGKVRDMYLLENHRVLITTDRQSAFDHVLGTIPLKGQVLNRIAQYWFEQTQDIAPNQVISVPDANVTVARELDILPVEVVVRKYLTGSSDTAIWTHYNRGVRHYCGHTLPDGMVKKPALRRGDHHADDQGRSPRRADFARRDHRPRPSARSHLDPSRGDRLRALCSRRGASGQARVNSRGYQIRDGARRRRGASRSPTRFTRPTRRASGSETPTQSATPAAQSPKASTRNFCAFGSATRAFPTTISRRSTTRSASKLPSAISTFSNELQALTSQPNSAQRRSCSALRSGFPSTSTEVRRLRWWSSARPGMKQRLENHGQKLAPRLFGLPPRVPPAHPQFRGHVELLAACAHRPVRG